MTYRTTRRIYIAECAIGHLISQVKALQSAVTELEIENAHLLELSEYYGDRLINLDMRLKNLESMEDHI